MIGLTIVSRGFSKLPKLTIMPILIDQRFYYVNTKIPVTKCYPSEHIVQDMKKMTGSFLMPGNNTKQSFFLDQSQVIEHNQNFFPTISICRNTEKVNNHHLKVLNLCHTTAFEQKFPQCIISYHQNNISVRLNLS